MLNQYSLKRPTCNQMTGFLHSGAISVSLRNDQDLLGAGQFCSDLRPDLIAVKRVDQN